MANSGSLAGSLVDRLFRPGRHRAHTVGAGDEDGKPCRTVGFGTREGSTNADIVLAKRWPDTSALMAAICGALRGTGGPPNHLALSLVCDLTLMYREHGEINQQCGAPPAVLGFEQARDIRTEAAAAELRFGERFDQLAAHTFELGQSRLGLLAARLVYWMVSAKPCTVHHFLAAALAYDQWLDRVSTPELGCQPVEAVHS